MSANKTAYITLLFLMSVAIVFLKVANTLPFDPNTDSSDPSYFPILLSILLIILCVINFFQTRKKEDEKIDLPNIRGILITIGITITYFLCWTLTGYFYLFTFIYLFTLFTYYRPAKKLIFLHVGIALVFTLFIYGVFDNFLNIRF